MKEATWLKGLIIELGVPRNATAMLLDSQSVIHPTKNDAYHSKTKRISIKYHYIRDTIDAGDTVMKKVHTADYPMDMLAKSLPITKF